MHWLFWVKWDGKDDAWIDSKIDSRTEIIIKAINDTITKRWIRITNLELVYVLLPILLWYYQMENTKIGR
jgi:hypothetical protein